MPFTKIQPQQLQLPTFTSPSGDLLFSDLSTGVEINLSRNISGPINIDDLTVNSREVLKLPSSSSVSSTSVVLAGTNNDVTGSNNVIINGSSNVDVSGSFNVLVNGTAVDFGASGQNNTILAGNGCYFGDQITGAVILADHLSTVNNDTNHSLLISFNSGVTFQNGNVTFEDPVTMEGDSQFAGSVDMLGDLTVGVDLDVTGNLGVTGAAQFNNDVTVDAPMTVTDSLTLDDGSDAASQVWVDERVGLSLTSAEDTDLTDALEGAAYSAINVTNLENVLTGTVLGSDIFTGHVLTGTSAAYFVLQGANFTGALEFTGNMYRAI